MIFGDVPLASAQGTILAHTVRVGGRVVKKGTCLSADDVAMLRGAGVQAVTVARLEAEDIAEDNVARDVANALCRDGVEASAPMFGRCNLYAQVHGLLTIDGAAVNRLNASGDGVLCATLPPDLAVEPGRLVATLKVIPYAIAAHRKDALLEIVKHGTICVHPFRTTRVGLILTRVEGDKTQLLAKAQEVLVARVETFNSEVVQTKIVEHDKHTVAGAIRALSSEVDLVLVLGSASTVDIQDTVPAAMIAAGGEVKVFGIPVDPGNLMTMGRLGGATVLGLPGCARSPKLNGIDLILPRVFSGLEVSADTVLALGVGGLLHDVAERPQPREPHAATLAPDDGCRVAAVVLAAGASRRMGADNKLLQDICGKAMVRHVVETVLASQVDSVVVVTGHEADQVRAVLYGLPVRFVHNPHYEEGLSTSVRVGVGHVPKDCSGALMVLGDMPKVTGDHINDLIAGFRIQRGHAICVPVFESRRGNPVLWPRDFFPDLLDLSGDVGARRLLDTFADRVVAVDLNSPGILVDVDTPKDLKGL